MCACVVGPYFFCSCTLAPETDNGPTPAPNSIVGTFVSSLHKLKDSDNTDGGFFVFGDLSIRKEGRFRLQFDLFELRDGDCIHRTTIRSDVFTVHSAKNFPGMAESTFLTRSFSDQGVRLRLRKDSRALNTRKRTSAAAGLNSMTHRKPIDSVGRCYEGSGIDSVKRRKFSQASSHPSLSSTRSGARSASGAYAVDTSVAATQSLMNSPVSYATQPPVLLRPVPSPGSYSQSPQSYGVPVPVAPAPETSQSYPPAINSAAEVPSSRCYALSPVENTTQGYSLATIQTSEPQKQPTGGYSSIHTSDSTTPLYQPHTPISTQLASVDYALPTPDTRQDNGISRTDGPVVSAPACEPLVPSSSVASMGSIVVWQQQGSHHHRQPIPATRVPSIAASHARQPRTSAAAAAYAGAFARHVAHP